MLGKSHACINVSATVAGVSLLGIMPQQSLFLNSVYDYFIPTCIRTLDNNFLSISAGLIWFMMMLFFVVVGSLLPDIDNRSSILGRYFYLPIGHRTWTHSIWAVILFVFLSKYHPFLGCICIGYVLHLLEDSVSAAGICFLYPFKKYISYGNGAFVAPNHKYKFYYVGKSSETRCMYIVILCCVIISYLCGIRLSGFSNVFNMLCYW